MKKIVTTFLLSIVLLSVALAQKDITPTLVTTDPMNKNVVLEEFTGIHCQYCPDGHRIAQGILNDNPWRVVLINIHQGGYANPGAGEPDYRTSFGDAIAGQTGLGGYPSGTVNRHIFGTATKTALDRGAWSSAANEILQTVSPVNVGLSSSYNSTTGDLTINVELYYTANSTQTANKLNVAILQNKIIGPQTGGSASYQHNHMLRYLITGQWGESITTTTAGTFVQKTYTYHVPTDFNGIPFVLENSDIAAYVTATNQEVYSGAVVPAINGTTLVSAIYSQPTNTCLNGTTHTLSSFAFNVNNNLNGSELFNFTLTKDNEPVDWTSTCNVAGTDFSETATVSLATLTNSVSINVTPGTSAGFATYTLTAQSVTYPLAPPITQKVYVMANVTDLLLNSFGNPDALTNEDIVNDYTIGLDYGGSTKYISIETDKFMMFVAQNQISGIESIFYNSGWGSTNLNDDIVEYFSTFLDGGGNLFIAGQDIGWDTWDIANGGSGTAITQAFYTNYLHATYVADGSEASTSLSPNATDPIFGTVQTSNIVDIYGAMYPDQISPSGSAETIFKYNGVNSAAIKYADATNNYKVVYLGVDLAMLSNVMTKTDIIRRSYLWFNDLNITPFLMVAPSNTAIVTNLKPTITVSFSEPMRNINNSTITLDEVLIAVSIKNSSNVSIQFTATINADNNLFTLTLIDYLNNLEDYTVSILGNTFETSNDIALPAGTSTFSTLVEVPTITTTPINNAIDIDPNANIQFVTNFKLIKDDGTAISNSDIQNLVTLVDNLGNPVAFTALISIDKKTLNINPTLALAPLTTYSVTFHNIRTEFGYLIEPYLVNFTTNNTVSILERNNNVKLYPNPATNFVNISAPQNSNVEIYNVTGQLIYKDVMKTDNMTINTSDFKAGIYIVKILSENSVNEQKIIIN